ncbi:molybdopterin-dependent oxidoreductase [Nocardioides sp. dk4132]|uniref:molybdopterin-dependent oxidoreductase n=1 Tax=unclassified Nocardioides TaxID=2615069 RepID=UPI001296194C|nr:MULTISPECIES: molybdopterin-dependent oxidoreductase [unclassified Nocardioides]MQW76931.1 molybdopterin-dependent oxidoreductase [Nocardioides sp. dk4132]QGA09353.1 molybdopterin-dependent oxidoreductase [Nocardioides sp. dk884]
MDSSRGVRALLSAGSGVLAALVGTAAGHLTAALLDPAASPVLAVGSTVIDWTPTPLKEWAIRTFGDDDKAVLVGSVLVGVLVLAAVAGLVARHRTALGAAMLVALTALAGAAALSRPQAGVVDVVPSLVAALTGVGALVWLVRAADTAPWPEPADDAARPSRRGVLVAAGVLGLAAAVMGGAGRWLTRLRLQPAEVDLPAATDRAPRFPTGLEERFPDITALRTPSEEFYRIDTRLDVPLVDVDDWRLTIDGDVQREVTLSFEDLLAMPLVERDITLTCVSNSVGGEYVGGARWLGVRLTDVLDLAGVGSGADQILSTDVDGMTISTPLELATDGRDALVAVGMNGAALPREHGFPVRLVIPGLYGFISATKWLERMTLTTYAAESAYWTDRDWATDAPIKLASRIDTPGSFDTIDAGDTVIGGIAWAQHRGGVARVEVSIDGGAWQPARLGPDVGEDYWRQWWLPWEASSGRHTLTVRAVDGEGETQTPVRADPFPEGASGLQQIVVDVD